MKALVAFLLSSFVALTGIAQTTAKVTLIFKSINKSTKNYQAVIDETSYYSNTNTKNLATYKIPVGDLQIGQHMLKLYRLKYNSTAYNGKTQNALVYSKTFDLRAGFNMNITVLASGRVQFSEVPAATVANPTVKTAMTANQFNALVRDVKSKWSQSLKGETIRDAIIATNSYFTSAQVKQLLGLITSESDRLDLAKLSYDDVTDPVNFYQVVDLFNSTTKREEFNTFLQSKSNQDTGNATKIQMSAARFSELQQKIQGNWSQAGKTEAVRAALIDANYFSSAQLRQLLSMVTSESDRLDLIKLSYPRVLDPLNFPALADLFNSSSYRAEFNSYVELNGGEVLNTAKSQMTTAQFNQLLNTVQGKWSQALKGEAIRAALINTNNYFSTSQIRQLLTIITNETDRLALAKLSYRGVTDLPNFYTLVDLFNNSANRTEFNAHIAAQGGVISGGTTTRTPMASGEFDLLVLGVRSNLLQPLKINAVRNAFSNANYYFSSSQARHLISLINSESSRLELAKLAYRTITDRENFTQLNDLFPTKTNRDNLAEYVRTYSGE